MIRALIDHGADAPGSPLETACVAAFKAVERTFERSSRGSFIGCLSGFAPPEGGTTACLVLAQRRRGGGIPGYKAHHLRRNSPAVVQQRVDIVAANTGDSGALLVPFHLEDEDESGGPGRSPPGGGASPGRSALEGYLSGGGMNDLRSATGGELVSGEAAKIVSHDRSIKAASGADVPIDAARRRSSGAFKPTEFKRLTREHNPDDPLEAKRLTDAGSRLGRMRVRGKEVGPLRTYPGGFAVSRAIGDLNAPAVICEPECTRISLPPGGGRLVVASDGMWNAMSDHEAAEVAAEADSPEDAAKALMEQVIRNRGLHDDITVLVVDFPPPAVMIEAAARVQPDEHIPSRPSSYSEDGEEPNPLSKRRNSLFDQQRPMPLAPIPQSPASSEKRLSARISETILMPSKKDQLAPVSEVGKVSDVKVRAAPRIPLEYDVTVRRGAHFREPEDEGKDGKVGGRKSAGEKNGGGGWLSCLCGGMSISATDAVDEVDQCDHLHDAYEVGNILGRGRYGSVRLAALKAPESGKQSGQAGEKRAVKSVSGDGTKHSKERIKDEVETMLAISGRHPNFPTLYGVYEEATVVHMVMDMYLGGKLLDALAQRKKFTVGDWEALAVQLLGAVSFMHTLGVVHRDIKPDNIMLKREWLEGDAPALVLVDFGSATFARGGKKLIGFEGTKFFASPECIQGKPYDFKSDVWSVGVVLMVLLTGIPPNNKIQEVWGNMLSGFMPRMPSSVPRRFTKLIASLLVCDPEERPNAAEVLAKAVWLLKGATGMSSTNGAAPNVLHEAAHAGTAPVERANAVSDNAAAAELAAMHTAAGLQNGTIRFGRRQPRLSNQGESPGLPPAHRLSASIDNELEGTVPRALIGSARLQFERAASFILAVVLDAKQVRTLVSQLRKGGVGDADPVPAALLEATLWTIGAKEAAIQLELLRAQTLSSVPSSISAAAAVGVNFSRGSSIDTLVRAGSVVGSSGGSLVDAGGEAPRKRRSVGEKLSAAGTESHEGSVYDSGDLPVEDLMGMHQLVRSRESSFTSHPEGVKISDGEGSVLRTVSPSDVAVRNDRKLTQGSEGTAGMPGGERRASASISHRLTQGLEGTAGMPGGERRASASISRRSSFTAAETRRTSFTFSSADNLSVDMEHLIDLADLHSRHRRVYEAVAVAGSTQRTALLTPNETTDSALKQRPKRLNTSASYHGGMLMALITRASSVLSMGGMLGDRSQSRRRASSECDDSPLPPGVTNQSRSGRGRLWFGNSSKTDDVSETGTPSPGQSLHQGDVDWRRQEDRLSTSRLSTSSLMVSQSVPENEEEVAFVSLTPHPLTATNSSVSKTGDMLQVGQFIVSNDPNSEAAAFARAVGGNHDESWGGKAVKSLAPEEALGSNMPTWWNEPVEEAVRDEHLALQALARGGVGNRLQHSQLAQDEERSRRGGSVHNGASRRSSIAEHELPMFG